VVIAPEEGRQNPYVPLALISAWIRPPMIQQSKVPTAMAAVGLNGLRMMAKPLAPLLKSEAAA
jgi:hypothetical protein